MHPLYPLNHPTRIGTDSMGEFPVQQDAYWDSQTARSLQFFAIGQEKMPTRLICALVKIKQAAAKVNHELGLLSDEVANLISQACQDILEDRISDAFPLKVWQTGSGTQTNMNVNEVIANRANQIAGMPLGQKHPVHPNDHVNLSQSSNDTFPSAMHLALAEAYQQQLKPVLHSLIQELEQKVIAFSAFIKVGRTHLQDAVPLTLGQEFSAFSALLADSARDLEHLHQHFYQLALGGTAVGTGLNSHPEFSERIAIELRHQTGLPFTSASNKFAALSGQHAETAFSGALKTLASHLFKMANDIRMLASGPRCGLGELTLPANEPGSSIMPGKVNPTQCEALTMICIQIMGIDTIVGFASSQGHFQLNVFKPLIAYNLLQGITWLSDGMRSFQQYALADLQVNTKQLQHNLEQSLMLVTALAPKLGYDKASEVAHYAHQNGLSLKQACAALDLISEEEFDSICRPENMLEPGSA